MKPILTALAVSALATTSLPTTTVHTTATPLSNELGPVACASQTALYEILNAADRHDAKEAARLFNGVCEPLTGVNYRIEKAVNGVLQLRIFPADGGWAKSHLAYTLDDMLAGAAQSGE
ncbi:MAG TPA: hypothetical protein VFA50_20120 [Stellaceae bacterium]|nr:hypothetical protein [Stellaceae bacterium]